MALSSRLALAPSRRISSHFTWAVSSPGLQRRTASAFSPSAILPKSLRFSRLDSPATNPPSGLPTTPPRKGDTSPASAAASSLLAQRLSRKERELLAIQEASGLVSEKEKRHIARKQEKRAKWAERMHAKHGDDWETIVQAIDRARSAKMAHRKLADDSDRLVQKGKTKKQRWTHAQLDAHRVYKANKRIMIDEKRARKRAQKRAQQPRAEAPRRG